MKLYNKIFIKKQENLLGYFILKDENNKWIFTDNKHDVRLYIYIHIVLRRYATRPTANTLNTLYGDLLNKDMNNLKLISVGPNHRCEPTYRCFQLQKDSYFFADIEESYNNLIQIQRQQKIEKIKAILNNN